MSDLVHDIAPVSDGKKYPLKAAAQEIGISVPRLLSWERCGILKSISFRSGKSKTRIYAGKDIMRAALVKLLMDTGFYTIEKAKHRVEQLG
jgi:DNA-binding transcriptional MerR regulator